jgi:hypothetical protein
MSTMDDHQRDAFLMEPRVAVLSVARRTRAPLTAPIWYEYRPGTGFSFVMSGNSAKAKRLVAEGRATVCVQDDRGRYRYVTAEGPVHLTPVPLAALRKIWRSSVERYLGSEGATSFLDAFDEPDPHIAVLVPESWRTEVFDDISTDS